MAPEGDFSARDRGGEAGSPSNALHTFVASDFDRIFKASGPGVAPAAPVQTVAPRRDRADRSRAGAIGAILAAALLGLTIGAVATGYAQQREPEARPILTASVAPTPSVALSAAAPPAETIPTAPIQEAPAPLAPVPEATQTSPATQAPPARTESARPARTRSTPIARASANTPAGRCERLRGDARARCAYPALKAADERLRTAYARATRAGVPRERLVAVRSQWSSLRRRANAEPTRVIASYRSMAAELTRAAETRTRRG